MTRIPQPKIERRIEDYVATRAAAAEARRLGLLEGEAWAERLLWTHRQVLASRTLLRLVGARVGTPGVEEVRRYFQSHREEFKRPEYFQLAAILLPALDGQNNRQVFAQGARLVQSLEDGETTFQEAAQRYSRHASARHGGELGWVSRPALPRIYGMTFLKAILRLQDGEMSDLVQDGKSLWIIRRLGTEEERLMTWDEARRQAEDRVGQARTEDMDHLVRQEWMERLQLQSAGAQSP